MEYNSEDSAFSKAVIIARYNALYRECMENGNIKGAKNILDSIAKIDGSMETSIVKTDFTVNWG